MVGGRDRRHDSSKADGREKQVSARGAGGHSRNQGNDQRCAMNGQQSAGQGGPGKVGPNGCLLESVQPLGKRHGRSLACQGGTSAQ